MTNMFAGYITLRDANQPEQTMESPDWKKVYEGHVKDDYIRVYDCTNSKLISLDGFGAGHVLGMGNPHTQCSDSSILWCLEGQGWLLKRYKNGEFYNDFRPEVLAEVDSDEAPWMMTEQ